MSSLLYNNDPMLPSNYCDTIIVDLRDTIAPYDLIVSQPTILFTDGNAQVQFSSSLANGSYYIAIRGRNIIETWSKLPVTLGNNTTFDFTQ